MKTITCPDCNGKGKHWRPPHMRTYFIPTVYTDNRDPSSSETGWSTGSRRECETCLLCAGSGAVAIIAAKAEGANHG